MIASDVNNRDFTNASDPDARLFVKFYSKPVQNEFRTLQEGRPIFEDVTFIQIQIPGDNTFNVDVPAREDHKHRFPMHWQRFQNAHGDNNQIIGTPLAQWPLLTPAIVEELKYQKYVTVEQIATASDQQINNLGMSGGMSPYALRDRAKKFLEVARGEAELNHYEEQLRKIREEQEQKDAQHAQEMAEMKAQIQALTQSVTKRGRKPQEKEAA